MEHFYLLLLKPNSLLSLIQDRLIQHSRAQVTRVQNHKELAGLEIQAKFFQSVLQNSMRELGLYMIPECYKHQLLQNS